MEVFVESGPKFSFGGGVQPSQSSARERASEERGCCERAALNANAKEIAFRKGALDRGRRTSPEWLYFAVALCRVVQKVNEVGRGDCRRKRREVSDKWQIVWKDWEVRSGELASRVLEGGGDPETDLEACRSKAKASASHKSGSLSESSFDVSLAAAHVGSPERSSRSWRCFVISM